MKSYKVIRTFNVDNVVIKGYENYTVTGHLLTRFLYYLYVNSNASDLNNILIQILLLNIFKIMLID